MGGQRPFLPLLVLLLLSPLASAQCCDVPVIHVMSSGTVTISGREVWTGDVFVNGSLVVEGDLLMEGANIVVGGAGIRITDGARLVVRDSTLAPHPSNSGFYIENMGTLMVLRSRIERCSDPGNTVIGMYQSYGSLTIDGSTLESSGLIHCTNSTVSVLDSTIPGLVASGGSSRIEGSLVDSTGLTCYGDGAMVVEDVHITSTVSFPTPISAITMLDGGDMVLGNVTVDGSYDGGSFSRGGKLSVRRMRVSLNDGLYGIRTMRTDIGLFQGLEIEGTFEGVTIQDPTGPINAKDLRVRANYTGILWKGDEVIKIIDSRFEGSTYGGMLDGPSTLSNCTFEDNAIGLLVQKGSLLSAKENTFKGFTKWGIEAESWEPVTWKGNSFEPSETAISDHAWWGLVNVSVIAEQGFPVEGALIEMTTPNEGTVRVQEGPVGMLWGWEDPKLPNGIAISEVSLSAKWGTSTSSLRLEPYVTRTVSIILPLSDINVTSVTRTGPTIRVLVVNQGPEVRDARVTIYLDGSYRDSAVFDLGPDSSETFSFDLADLGPGEREVTARVFGRDEYSGSGGALLKNNEMSIRFLVSDKDGNDVQYILVGFCIMSVSLIVLLLVTFVKRSGPKV